MKRKQLSDDPSLYFVEEIKRNINKVLRIVASKATLEIFHRKIIKNLKYLKTAENQNNNEYTQRRYHVAFLVKAYTECLRT